MGLDNKDYVHIAVLEKALKVARVRQIKARKNLEDYQKVVERNGSNFYGKLRLSFLNRQVKTTTDKVEKIICKMNKLRK